MPTSPTIAIIGIGQPYRGDDAAGLAVVEQLTDLQTDTVRVTAFHGDATELIHLWEDAEWVILIDAAQSGVPAGTLHHFEVQERPLPSFLSSWSSHSFGLPEAITLAKQFGRLPKRMEIYAIEGERFGMGDEMSPTVSATCRKLAADLRRRIQTEWNPAG